MHIARSLFFYLTLVGSLEALAIARRSASSDAIVEIEYALNLFAHLVDTHKYTSLGLVFTTDAVADFATPAGYIDGLATIEQGLQDALGGTVSQHTLSTYVIKVLDTDSTRATADTYLEGTVFGQGNATGQYLTTFGSYIDLLQLTESGWRIYNKTLVVTGQTGDAQLSVS